MTPGEGVRRGSIPGAFGYEAARSEKLTIGASSQRINPSIPRNNRRSETMGYEGLTIGAKWTMDGAETLAEAAQRLERERDS